MNDLEQIVEEDSKKGFLETLKRELLATGKLYLNVIKRPSLLAEGIYHAVRDILYELPKSLFHKSRHKDLKKRLNEKASQALVLSEAITVPGTYIGFGLFKTLGAGDYTASVIGGSVGNYVSGALSYIIAYNLLTRGNEKYSIKDAFICSCKVIKDCFLTAMILYLSETPIISGLLAAGLSSDIAVGLNLAGGMVIFTGVAKYSTSQNIEKY
ncbi:hypothetical protein J4232_04655 [Candidatus Woesearchaeota archaeon]|nr:hypothetical protein [Candidatus Woesearchaeota archaeon]